MRGRKTIIAATKKDVYKRQLPHAPGAEREQDTAAAERVLERIDGARTRKASKKAARKAQAEAEARTRTSRLQFTEEERATPELEKAIRKSERAADRLDEARAAIPVSYTHLLMKQNAGVSSIEITDSNIKAFESTAKKYGVDFALKMCIRDKCNPCKSRWRR